MNSSSDDLGVSVSDGAALICNSLCCGISTEAGSTNSSGVCSAMPGVVAKFSPAIGAICICADGISRSDTGSSSAIAVAPVVTKPAGKVSATGVAAEVGVTTGLAAGSSKTRRTGRGCVLTLTSIPVATTETRSWPSNAASRAEPKMIFASASTSSPILFAASSTSNSVMSGPPVILIRTPRAPFMETSSNSGFDMAASAARRARSSPSASPVPIMAFPISHITLRISAKSRLIRPGTTIRSVTPRTPECNTSSAMANASANVVFSLAIRNRF